MNRTDTNTLNPTHPAPARSMDYMDIQHQASQLRARVIAAGFRRLSNHVAALLNPGGSSAVTGPSS